MAGKNEVEPAKLLLPYLQRADELQNHDPLVAYYCRMYAMERGLKIPQSDRTKTTNSLLVSLMNQLEKDRKSLKLSPDDNLHVEGFALNVFAKADKQDRAGRADMDTAKTFYAASIFFEILNQFGELAPDLEQKQKYAAWKAADIRKALKEGKKPVPGPPGGGADLSTLSTPTGFHDVEQVHAGNDIHPSSQPNPTPPTQHPDGLKRHTSTDIEPTPQPRLPDDLKKQKSFNIQPSPPFPNGDYSSQTTDYPPASDYQSAANPPSTPGNLNYPQPYHGQSYPQEPHQPSHFPQNYPSQDTSASFAYPNFQSYPSFSDSSLPAASSHYPSHVQGSSDLSYSHQNGPSPSVTNVSAQVNPNSRNRNKSDVPTTRVQTYQYDSNYQPPPEKIAEAQKAARFAVGALAFDEVPVAVEHLRNALEYLTNPSAGH